jgi:hypothetical protein
VLRVPAVSTRESEVELGRWWCDPATLGIALFPPFRIPTISQRMAIYEH